MITRLHAWYNASRESVKPPTFCWTMTHIHTHFNWLMTLDVPLFDRKKCRGISDCMFVQANLAMHSLCIVLRRSCSSKMMHHFPLLWEKVAMDKMGLSIYLGLF